MRISDWSSDVCSSDLWGNTGGADRWCFHWCHVARMNRGLQKRPGTGSVARCVHARQTRSEEHTSELQSLMRISYAVFCLKNKTQPTTTYNLRQSINFTTYIMNNTIDMTQIANRQTYKSSNN